MTVEEVPKMVELAATAAVTLLSTFTGAYLAFIFNKRQQAGALELARVEACNAALVVLARQYSLLRNHYDQHLKAHENKAGRHLHNDALLELRPAHSVVDLPAITFLLGTAARDTVMQISDLNAIFQTCIDTINMRSLVHREQYQPALEKLFEKKGTTRLSGLVVIAGIGERLNVTLKRITDDVYTLVLGALPKFESAGKQLQTEFKKVYPAHTIISFEPALPTVFHHESEVSDAADFRQRPVYRRST